MAMSLRTNRASALKIFSLSAFLLLVTAMPVWGQIATGTILGNVTDPGQCSRPMRYSYSYQH